MNVLLEEDGSYKAGHVLSDAGANLQVELATGRRVRIKAAAVMLRFETPTPADLMQVAQTMGDAIDLDFLWEIAPQDEFAFDALALDWFGRAPTAVEATALLLRLHGAPIYFHRKGKGRYRPASAEQLKAALAGLERKRQQQEVVDGWVAELTAGVLPAEIRAAADALVFAPDKMSLEWKALDRACQQTQRSPERLMLALGAFDSPRALHMRRFLREQFPAGSGFPPHVLRLDPQADAQTDPQSDPARGSRSGGNRAGTSGGNNALAQALRAAIPETLPDAGVEAFSIDDSTTTEIDDALSVTLLADGRLRVGIHIAAPGRDLTPGSTLDKVGRARMSTVYMPGDKITMLPDNAIERWSLDSGRHLPALSMYVDLDETGTGIVDGFSRVDRVRIVENLRHDHLEGVVTEALLNEAPESAAPTDLPRAFALRALWRLTLALGAERDQLRGKPEPRNRVDFSFYIDREPDGAEKVRIVQRRRDAPLDRIVAELMILANARWGRLLADHRVPGIYRIQPPGTRVRMATHAAPHAGLGVAQYAWCTSPLRRYVDLVNQRQVIAVLTGRTPPYTGSDADLFAVLSAFDAKYEAYADFQSRMERWWCLRWLQQEGLTRVEAVVTRDDMARLVHAPLVLRVTGMPMLSPGRRIVIDLVEQDELDLTIHARFVEVDGGPEGAVDGAVDDGVDSEAADSYGVIGNPIAHSRSPSIHAAFALATGQAIVYERILAPVDGFVATVEAFRARGGRGLNVTLPFKQEAFAYATERTPRAEAAGAVNTLVFGADGVLGDNTDGIGLLRDLARLGVSLAGASVLVLGAGGAARGALAALLNSGCVRLAVANRTPERAEALAADPLLMGVEAVAMEALESLSVDVVINATSGGLQGERLAVPDALLRDARLAYDMVYAGDPTPFMQQAQAAGCPLCVDGLGMLVEQAAESFQVWRAVMPDTEPVLQAMRAELVGSREG